MLVTAGCLEAAEVELKTISGSRLRGPLEFKSEHELVLAGKTIPLSTVEQINFHPVPLPGVPLNAGGTGLLATYFDRRDFSGAWFRRLDPEINWNWQDGEPLPGIEKDRFSVRWEGEIEAPASGTFTFYWQGSDSGRVWIDQRLVCEKTTNQSSREVNGQIVLQLKKRYPVRAEFDHLQGPAEVRLLWSHTLLPKALVPRSQLFPKPGALTQLPSSTSTNGLAGLYFDNLNFEGEPLVRFETNLFFSTNQWPALSPSGKSELSARWLTRVRAPLSERFIFMIETGDAIRFWLNDRLLIAEEQGGVLTAITRPIPLVEGEVYEIKAEAILRAGKPLAKLKWSSQSLPMGPIPADAFLRPGVAPPAPPPSLRTFGSGLLLWDGSFVGSRILRADASGASVDGRNEPYSLEALSLIALHHWPLPQEHLPASGRFGLLLKSGDFVDGEFSELSETQVEIVTELFGTREYPRDQVEAIILRDKVMSPAVFEIFTRDNSVLRVRRIRPEKDRVILETAAMSLEVEREQLSELRRLPAN